MHDRPYRRAWPLERVSAEIESGGGSHFDPAIVQVALSEQGRGHMSLRDVSP
jgi:HD-GYP domain-containing protein (c-di-GMP phosphodiesterase class II)